MKALLVAFVLCALCVPAKAEEIQLVITFVTAGRDTPNMQQAFPEDSMDQCWQDAHDFVAHEVPEAVADKVVAVMAACARSVKPTPRT